MLWPGATVLDDADDGLGVADALGSGKANRSLDLSWSEKQIVGSTMIHVT